MIDRALLKQLGVTPKALKAAFTTEDPSPLIKQWKERARDRIKEAVNQNLREFQVYWAIDKAVDSSFYQSSRTLFQGMLDNKFSTETVLSMVKEWGFNSWLTDACGCGGGCSNASSCTKPMQRVDVPALFEVTFPIALAYKNVRLARIYNDRNLVPLMKYEPMVNTAKHRLKNEIITQRVQVQSQQMDYKSVLKQVINQMLTYSQCVTFPKEAWWCERQPTKEVTGKKRGTKVVREGIRYEHPHPSRTYIDLAHPAYTLNSNTGCQYGGYWGLVRYGDVIDNDAYWNTDKITFGRDSFRIRDTNRTFFATVYPCQMKFPEAESGSLGGEINREERMQVYTRNHRDTAVLFTNHFERLNPLKDLGLKNKAGEGYDGEVWFRMITAADDTVIYAEPLAYDPMRYAGYDPDANKARVPSLVMECIPAQDMVGNLITQAILQAKNNLININFVNTDVLDQSVLDGVMNLGEKKYRVPLFIPFSLHESTRTDNDRRDAIIPAPIQRFPIAECLTLIRQVLEVLERGLVMSANELAGTASHELTAQEVMQTASSTSTRLNYTASGVDDFIYAWQRQLLDAGMAYWDDDVFAQVALQNDADKKVLEEIGFKIESENTEERTAGVRGDKENLELDEFTIRRDAADRVNNAQVAGAMTNLFQMFVNNPMLIEIIGANQFVQMVNGILDSFQFKKDWRLRAENDPIADKKAAMADQKKMAEQQMRDQKELANKQVEGNASNGVAEQLKQLIPQLQQQTLQAVGEQLKPVFDKAAQVDQQQQQQIQALEEATAKIAQVLQAAQPAPPVQMGAPMIS